MQKLTLKVVMLVPDSVDAKAETKKLNDNFNIVGTTSVELVSVEKVEPRITLHSSLQSPGARLIQVVFNAKPSKDTTEAILDYWTKIPYVSGGNPVTGIAWNSSQGRIRLTFTVDFSASTSKNIAARKPVETLLGFLENGTTLRRDKTRAHNAAGKVDSINIW